jgi:hypothetical protein
LEIGHTAVGDENGHKSCRPYDKLPAGPKHHVHKRRDDARCEAVLDRQACGISAVQPRKNAPARDASAIAPGTNMKATESPPRRSLVKSSRLYVGSHVKIGETLRIEQARRKGNTTAYLYAQDVRLSATRCMNFFR